MKSNTHNIKAIAVLWFQLYLHVKLEKQHNILFDWECCTSAATCWTELTHRERGRERCVRAEPSWRTEREGERGVCALNRADAPREREREVCALNRADAPRERESCVRAEPSWRTEREGKLCARCDARPRACAAVPVILRNEIRFGCFFEGKKIAKGVCNVAKLATLCISISPDSNYGSGHGSNRKYVLR